MKTSIANSEEQKRSAKRREETSGSPNNVYREPEKEKTAGEHLPIQTASHSGDVCAEARPDPPSQERTPEDRGQVPPKEHLAKRTSNHVTTEASFWAPWSCCHCKRAHKSQHSPAERGAATPGGATAWAQPCWGGGGPSTSVLPTPTGFCLEQPTPSQPPSGGNSECFTSRNPASLGRWEDFTGLSEKK